MALGRNTMAALSLSPSVVVGLLAALVLLASFVRALVAYVRTSRLQRADYALEPHY
jgi:hypothetical protein